LLTWQSRARTWEVKPGQRAPARRRATIGAGEEKFWETAGVVVE
jgi:hypothetical protein